MHERERIQERSAAEEILLPHERISYERDVREMRRREEQQMHGGRRER